MKYYRTDMISSHFKRSVKKIIHYNRKIIDLYNHNNNINMNPDNITITKILTSTSARSVTFLYFIRGCEIAKNFFQANKYQIIKLLKNKIKMSKFPQIIFKYDEEYEKLIELKIKEVLNNYENNIEENKEIIKKEKNEEITNKENVEENINNKK